MIIIGQKYKRNQSAGCCSEGTVKEIEKKYILLTVTKCTQEFKGFIDISIADFKDEWELVNESKLIRII